MLHNHMLRCCFKVLKFEFKLDLLMALDQTGHCLSQVFYNPTAFDVLSCTEEPISLCSVFVQEPYFRVRKHHRDTRSKQYIRHRGYLTGQGKHLMHTQETHTIMHAFSRSNYTKLLNV
uniref:Vacuolar protein sorting-associated protein 20 homolog 1 n=1 Tax=Rhizophora mucronata TaxID=61149 RepID=A0A2P2JK03_RHIMU